MLVYKLQDMGTSDISKLTVEVPAFLKELVDRDNQKFEEWCNEMADMRKQSVVKGKAKHEEVKELYELLPAKDGEPYEFISLEWLKKWLDDSTATKEIDNSSFLCSHGKLHPDKVGDCKRISLLAAQQLFNRYGGGPRLESSSLCRECVEQRCKVLRLKNQLNEDYKEVSNLVKHTPSEDGYWVGKTSLRSWRQLALDKLEAAEHETNHSNGETNGQGPTSNSNKELSSETYEGNEEEMKILNEDIVCSHGGLRIVENERKVVSAEVWSKLKTYFPNAPEFPQNQEPCQQCLTLEQEEKDNEAVSKMMALEQKNQLPNLFQDKNRPTLTKWPPDTDELFIVPVFFVDEWRKFIRRPTKSSPVSNVGNGLLLCPHGGFMFTYESLLNGDTQHIALLWPSEWEIMRRLFIVDQAISIRVSREATPNGPVPQYTTDPDLCWDCREGFLFQQQRDLREYTQATIYIRKVLDDKDAAPEPNGSSSDAEEDKEETPRVDEENEAHFNQSQNGSKRIKLDENISASSGAALASTNATKAGGIRRSTRHRKLRGEKALIVSANQTLKELKIQIMHAFSVAPFDQNLSINGKSLTDDMATLGSLGVIPESVVCLKADEPIADYAAMDDVYQVRIPEEGFKGTGLLGH